VRIHRQQLEAACESPELILCDLGSFQSVDADKVIVVCKSLKSLNVELKGAAAVAVVDSSDEHLLAQVSHTRLPAITCGLKSKDTITLSSIGADSAVVDLRRSISCMSGNKVEPAEFPLRTKRPIDSFMLMSVVSVLILAGKMESLKEGFI